MYLLNAHFPFSPSLNFTDRTEARQAVETNLLVILHTIAAKFPRNVPECLSYFDFSLLFNVVHHSTETFSGVIAAGEKVAALNRTLTNGLRLRITNPDDNASMLVYLAASGDAEAAGTGKEIKPGKTRNFKPGQLGDLNNTFLIVKNLSSVNYGSYEIAIKG